MIKKKEKRKVKEKSGDFMGRLVIDGNKVYTVDESCMRRKRLSLEQVRRLEHNEKEKEAAEQTVYRPGRGKI